MPYKKINKKCGNPKCTFEGLLQKDRTYCSPDCYQEWRALDKARYLDNLVERFDVDMVVEGDIMCANDFHIPYTDPDIFRYLLAIKDKFDIGQLMIGGDLFNADAVKKGYAANAYEFPLDKEVEATERFFEILLEEFDTIHVFLGNHDERILHALDGGLRGEQLSKLALPTRLFKEIDDRIFFSSQRFATIISDGVEYRYTHPANYSRNCPTVERQLATVFNTNILGTHGHMWGVGFDTSGSHVCAQLGCMIDRDKVPYVNLVDTNHPRWNKGFGMVRKGFLYPFAEGFTDWDFYLGEMQLNV